MIHDDLRNLEALCRLSKNLNQMDRLNHYEGANLDDPSLKAAIRCVNRKIYQVRRKIRRGIKELADRPGFRLNGVKLSKTAVKALIGQKGYEQVVRESRETFLDDPFYNNTFNIGYGNLSVEFFERDDEED